MFGAVPDVAAMDIKLELVSARRRRRDLAGPTDRERVLVYAGGGCDRIPVEIDLTDALRGDRRTSEIRTVEEGRRQAFAKGGARHRDRHLGRERRALGVTDVGLAEGRF